MALRFMLGSGACEPRLPFARWSDGIRQMASRAGSSLALQAKQLRSGAIDVCFVEYSSSFFTRLSCSMFLAYPCLEYSGSPSSPLCWVTPLIGSWFTKLDGPDAPKVHPRSVVLGFSIPELAKTRLSYRFSAFWLRSKCSICSYQLNI